jgi:nucleotide-binding universal stress UspA family protein
MPTKILVPLDGSDFAEFALPLALSLAERSRSDVHLASVVTTLPPLTFSEAETGKVKGWFAEERVRAKKYLEKVRARVESGSGSVPVHIRVLSGSPVEALDERVRATGVDLVVMTTHGRGALQRAWLGSVADGLIRRNPSPVLLRRPEEGRADLSERPVFERILVPLDGSSRSEAILPGVAWIAGLFGARLFLMSVAGSSFPLASAYLPTSGEESSGPEYRMAEVRSYLSRATADLRNQGVEVEAEAVGGLDAAEGILDHADRIGADLVAMTTRGRGGVARWVLGSVADKVIRAGKVPVLLHRQPDESD